MKNSLFVHLNSGLGNLMFQIAVANAYALKHNKNLIFHQNFYSQSNHKPIEYYFDNIFSKLNFQRSQIFIEDSLCEYEEDSFNFLEIPYVAESLILKGYFQSYLYFQEKSKEVVDFFDLSFEINKQNLDLLNDNTCSIHVRLGDYNQSQHAHPIQSEDYYKSAMKEFDKNTRFLIFSDEITSLKNKNFLNEDGSREVFYIENQKPHEDLKLMSLCKNNIIANSTFSWWAAYLNRNENKKVIYPKKWFTDWYAGVIKTSSCPKDLFPENWKAYD